MLADHTQALLTSLNIERTIVIGHSMGGQASIKLAVTHPDAIEKLILVAPAGLERFTEPEAILMKNALLYKNKCSDYTARKS